MKTVKVIRIQDGYESGSVYIGAPLTATTNNQAFKLMEVAWEETSDQIELHRAFVGEEVYSDYDFRLQA
jgi:hypothetical protein